MKSRTCLLYYFYLIAFAFQAVNAEGSSQSSENAFDWIEKMASAPRVYNYTGTFVYYADDHMETSQITHRVDPSGGEHEKVEVLDGLERIIYRNNDEMKCYLPDSNKIYTEKRWFRKFFPDLLPQPSKKIIDNYKVKTGKRDRVAGSDCQILKVIPRDNLRYGYQFCIHVDSGLLLKAVVLDKESIVEQFAFVRIEIGKDIDAKRLKPDLLNASENWETINLSALVLDDGELDWRLDELPAGFRKVTEMKRNLVGKSMLVDHIVLSDELAYVSIFIEPNNKDMTSLVPGFYSSRGAINIYVREMEHNKVTAVGEVPLKTIKLIGDAVSMQ